jgi:hypothetical protein
MVDASKISWTAEPDARLEEASLLDLEDDELLAYIAELRQDFRGVRSLLSEALTVIRTLTVRLDRQTNTNDRLHVALRDSRAEVLALRRQLDSYQGHAA